MQRTRMSYGFYAVFLKEVKCGDLRYGRNFYDYLEGTLVFLAPHQVIGLGLELQRGIDKHSKTLIVSNIELLLNYCIRFYDRQFVMRENVNKDILVRFEELLNGYFQTGEPQLPGLPSVSYCAGKLHLSANYFGDLIKKETGKSAQEHIQLKLLKLAKEKVLDTSKSISEVAYELGFKYPQHFTRFFKKGMGYSPNEYRVKN